MTTVATYLVVTFVLGFGATLLRLPPLVGFLAAGFVLAGMGAQQLPQLQTLADLGVTLLLFGIGLKLDVRSLARREVWLTTSLHLAGSLALALVVLALLGLLGFPLLAGLNLGTLALLAFALSFSSTVFVMKVLEQRGQSHAFYGRIAVGVLILQDLAAVIFLTASGGTLPSPWAIAIVGLWPAARLFRRVWSRVGHGEMQSLFGIVMALVPGYLLFDAVGLKGDLGALVVGMLLASHPAASELSRSLFHLKELLLVGFFVSIGLTGTPTLSMVGLAVVLVLLLPLKAAGYVALLALQSVRHRTSVLAGGALANFSEFGLIVAAVGAESGLIDQQWLIVLSLAVALSFVLASLANGPGQPALERLAQRLPHQDPMELHPEDRPGDARGAEVIVLGMGRVGRAAYERLEDGYGLKVVGVDADGGRVQQLRNAGLVAVEGDASDAEFWNRLRSRDKIRIAIVAMPRHGANLSAVRALRKHGFTGKIAAVARYDDEVNQAHEDGASAAFNVYAGAGLELADQVTRLVDGIEADPRPTPQDPDGPFVHGPHDTPDEPDAEPER